MDLGLFRTKSLSDIRLQPEWHPPHRAHGGHRPRSLSVTADLESAPFATSAKVTKERRHLTQERLPLPNKLAYVCFLLDASSSDLRPSFQQDSVTVFWRFRFLAAIDTVQATRKAKENLSSPEDTPQSLQQKRKLWWRCGASLFASGHTHRATRVLQYAAQHRPYAQDSTFASQEAALSTQPAYKAAWATIEWFIQQDSCSPAALAPLPDLFVLKAADYCADRLFSVPDDLTGGRARLRADERWRNMIKYARNTTADAFFEVLPTFEQEPRDALVIAFFFTAQKTCASPLYRGRVIDPNCLIDQAMFSNKMTPELYRLSAGLYRQLGRHQTGLNCLLLAQRMESKADSTVTKPT